MNKLRNLDLNLLIIFEAIYTTKNISQAAKQLGLSQPTLSNSLTRLRDTLDDPLFVRKGRGVEPTTKATKMVGPVRDALQMIQSGVQEADEFDPSKHHRHFRILMLDLVEPIVMPRLIKRIQNYRSVTIESLPILHTDISEALNDGSIDLAFCNYYYDIHANEQQAVGTAKLVAVARKDHPAIKGEFTLENFETLGHMALIPELWARSSLSEALHAANIDRHVAYTVSKFWSFPSILSQTDLIAILPSDFASHVAQYYPLDVFPLPFDLPEQQFYMIWKDNRNNDSGHIWLREQIQQAYDERADKFRG